MRTAFIGSNSLTVATAELLLADGHEVIMVERDRSRIDTLADRLDAGFVHGDGTSPDVLRDAEPENTDVLFCLLESDQTNILAALIGRSLGFARVVPRVNERQFQYIATELGLEDAVLPNQAVANHLRNLLGGEKSLELSSVIRDDATVFSFVAGESEAMTIEELDLPGRTRIVCLYRQQRFRLPDETRRIKTGDEIILICARDQLDELQRRWGDPTEQD
ncbi:MAG: NAD-binding protein [Thiohalocapsa sp.]|jgi:trk system potassium uptake protein TrkA|uniref:potassium channel family protein n=1 Tax=Thiohalocapsa sp. TaxID=2497641 RepID=UPI0025E7B54E|nr:NAD-binding protein [Thiohalocapsa sp.]MCG6943404.1 NAD-binding protein [Thiohalocapsa sp.]